MTLFFVSFRLTLKRFLQDRVFLFVTATLWVVLLAAAYFLGSGGSTAQVRAGILCDPADPLVAELLERLPQEGAARFEHFSLSQQEEVETLVQTRQLECAYRLEADFSASIYSGNWQGSITWLTSPASLADALMGELLFGALLETVSPDIAVMLTKEVFPNDDPDLVQKEVLAHLEAYRADPFQQILSTELDHTGQSVDRLPFAARPLHGILALFLLALNLFLIPRLIADRDNAIWLRLGTGGLLRHYGGVWVALFCLNLLAGLPALGILALAYPAVLSALSWESAALAVYLATLVTWAILFSVLLPTSDPLYASSIFILLTALVLGGVLVDWKELHSGLGSLAAVLPTTQYIDSALHQNIQSLIHLLTLTLFAAAASLLRFLQASHRWRR